MVIEGEIATTHLIERILLACEPHGVCYRKQFLSALKIQDFLPNSIPLFVRCGEPVLEYWIDLLRRAKHPYLYYIDDNFWLIQGDSHLARYYQHPIIRRSLECAVTHASNVLTNSDELALFLGSFNCNIKMLPSFFDFSLIDSCVKQSTEEIRIGFAGSSSRVDDLDIVRPVIFPILDAFPNAVFEFAGVMPQGIEQSDRVRFFPHTPSYSAFVRFQAERNWSIGLAPLVDSEANRCKTNNKYREYGACKIAGVYSDLQPYKRSVMPGVSGLLVENSTEAWFAAINRLATNSLERNEIGEHAYDDVRNKHCVERVSKVWASCIAEIDHHIQARPSIPLQVACRHGSFEKMRIKVDTLRVQFKSTYNIGGVQLVIRQSMRRLFKMASQRVMREE
jgi:hypothetical protein